MGKQYTALAFVLFACAVLSLAGLSFGQPASHCLDGTLNGTCSTANPPLYCDEGDLVFEIGVCGADAGKCCQSVKDTAGWATYLAVNVPPWESCINAYEYFPAGSVGGWIDNTFTDSTGIALVAGGFPTRVICLDVPFIVENEHGMRRNNSGYIYVPRTDTTWGDRTSQRAILVWDYFSDSYAHYNGASFDLYPVQYPGSDIYNCRVLDQPDTIYRVQQDIIQTIKETCFTIAADNVTLDCQGHLINGTEDIALHYVSGVYSNYSNTTIKNCVIAGFYDGI